MANMLIIKYLYHMKELSVVLRVRPVRKMRQAEYRFFADSFSFVPSVEDSDPGRLFDCSKDITIETPPADILREFSVPRSAVVCLRDSSGEEISIGTDDIPATVFISANLNTSTLKISCKMLHSPFSPA